MSRIPVVLVTGFLGSGKTTLVNRLLKSRAFSRAAVVVNEYGEASVDHLLIGLPRRRMRVVDGGCLCGHVHEEVAATLLDLYEQRDATPESPFDAVLIETSGLADPVPILQILATDREVAGRYRLAATVTVADGLHGTQHLAVHTESVKQAAVADLIVIGKTDLAPDAVVDQLAEELARVNNSARQIRVAHGAVDPDVILDHMHAPVAASPASVRRWLGDGIAGPVFSAANDPAIATFVLEYDREITLPGFILWMNLLAGFRGAGLLRVKGVVNVEGSPYAVQAVQTVISEPVPLEEWPDDDRRSRLVFITRHMDAEDMRRTFGAFDFEAGRERRNAVINPANFEKFKQAIAPFRRSASPNRS